MLKKLVLKLAKMLKNPFSRLLQLTSRLSQWGREKGLNSNTTKSARDLQPRSRVRGASGWEIPKRRC